MPDEAKRKREETADKDIQKKDAAEAIKTNDAMINYLSKEIETMSVNMITSRNRISFSLWGGPFLLLASIIVGTKNGGIGMQIPGWDEWDAWVALIGGALLFFTLIALIVGRIEQGAWKQCDEWRRCILILQSGKPFDREQFEEKMLYPQLREKVLNAYFYVFYISLLTLAAVGYFIAHLVTFQECVPPAVSPL